MYKCDLCKRSVKPNIKMERVVIETRPKTYPPVSRDGKYYYPKGYETVREIAVCPECLTLQGE